MNKIKDAFCLVAITAILITLGSAVAMGFGIGGAGTAFAVALHVFIISGAIAS